MATSNIGETRKNFGRSSISVCLLLIVVVGGCQQRTAGKLLGRWIGRPDAAAARALREAEKYGDAVVALPETTVESVDVTDWERYDLAVQFNFVSHDRLEMSLGDGSQPIIGEWRILETSPTGCIIEVKTESSAVSPSDDQSNSSVRRRFQLELDERGGEYVGFLLTEVGADRQLGSLYFRRPE